MDIKNIKKGKIEKQYDVYIHPEKLEEFKIDKRDQHYRNKYIRQEVKKGHVGNYGIVRIGIADNYQKAEYPYILYDGTKIIGKFKTGDDAADERERLYGF